MTQAVESMTALNKYAAQCCSHYHVHACTDVTGFGFLGHLHEMMGGNFSCIIQSAYMPIFEEALTHAGEFLLTAAAQRNRNYLTPFVQFQNVPFAMEEVLFDPQTSGGLLIALPAEEAESLVQDLGAPAAIVGTVTEKKEAEITVI